MKTPQSNSGGSIFEELAARIPHGSRCDGCPKGDPHGITDHAGDVFCHLMEEVMIGGVKQCAINDHEWTEIQNDELRQPPSNA